MIDLEKEREAFKVFKERELQPPSEHDLFLTWLYRACRAEDKFLKMKKEIVDLKAQLAKYESKDVVVVPRVPTKEMLDAGFLCGYGSSTREPYKAMIEVGEIK